MDALRGVRVVELPGLAPVPFCAQILAHFGADVTFVEKASAASTAASERRMMERKRVVRVDFATEAPKLRALIAAADVLLDPYRPGVLEAIGLDPLRLLEVRRGRALLAARRGARNFEALQEQPALIVARISGYGQSGRMSRVAGHDINYVALSGVMSQIAGAHRPHWPPANLLADFAGGALAAAFAVCATLVRRERNGGAGAIIDASMTEGVAYLSTFLFANAERAEFWAPDFGFLTGNLPIYRTYATKDSKSVACGALEPKFHEALFKVLGIDPAKFDSTADIAQAMEAKFLEKTRDEWIQEFEGVDACVSPVLERHEVGNHPHHKDRQNFTKVDGNWLPRPSPRIYTREQFARHKAQAKL